MASEPEHERRNRATSSDQVGMGLLAVAGTSRHGREISPAMGMQEGRTADLRSLVGDEVAFREWYDAAMPRVYAYLYSRCGGDPELAEELTQQVFVEAVRRPDAFAGRSESVTWLIGIGRHKLVDHFRRASRERARVREIAPLADEQGAWSQAGLRADVGQALRQLSGEHRMALVLHVVDGLPVRSVAEILGRSEDATESLIRRARAAFRQAYGADTDG